jgi:UDP-MurNAc hydroxylase
MRITFYANACCTMEAKGFRILTDPWLVDGAFEGSWCHYPPLKTRPEDIAGVDALFISHVHPDHCDPHTLAAFRRDIPIIVLDHGPNFLHRVLREMGFTDLRPIESGACDRIGPFDVTLYAPFTAHIFHESRIGNLIDCAALFEHDGISVLNLNDNTPDLVSAQRLRERHGPVTVAQIAYNAAGPYPASFDNLSAEQKLAMSDKILARNLDLATELARILEPRWHMPFAGSYVLGGRHWRRNACLGATSADVAAQAALDRNPDVPVLLLNEAQTFDLTTGARSGEYRPIVRAEELRYIEDVLAHRPYPYETDPEPDAKTLERLCVSARARLWKKQQVFDFYPDLTVAIGLGKGYFAFDMREPGGRFEADRPHAEPRITVGMDPKLLRRVLTGEAHWNNAENGCHFTYVREPDVYVRDFHTLMSFFAADPADVAAAEANATLRFIS